MVATVLNGDAIPVLQRRIFDAGFENLDIIPLGADKVLLRTEDDSDVNLLLAEASEFFANFFSNIMNWRKDMVVRERGAWVRIYGVPLQAWNLDFFKLCVFDYGRLLKLDDSTLEKIRFDYARVLISTPSVDLVISDAKVMIDGAIYELKIVEEGGFSLGEDACLSEDEEVKEEEDMEDERNIGDLHVDGEVDNLMKHLSEEWQKEQQDLQVHKVIPINDFPSLVESPVVGTKEVSKGVTEVSSQNPCAAQTVPLQQANNKVVLEDDIARADLDRISCSGAKRKKHRTSSCPPSRVHTVSAGPWSWEWARQHKELVIGDAAPVEILDFNKQTSSAIKVTRKKGNSSFRHCAMNLKRIARLSEEDRKVVLRALRKKKRRHKVVSDTHVNKVNSPVSSSVNDSQSSVNYDWSSWLVLHGNSKALSDDVRGMGKLVGVNFQGDIQNRFDVLSGVGRKNKEVDGGER